jgi:hypothetical protein
MAKKILNDFVAAYLQADVIGRKFDHISQGMEGTLQGQQGRKPMVRHTASTQQVTIRRQSSQSWVGRKRNFQHGELRRCHSQHNCLAAKYVVSRTSHKVPRRHSSWPLYFSEFLGRSPLLKWAFESYNSSVVNYVSDKNGHHGVVLTTDRAEANYLYLATCFLQTVYRHYSSYLDHLRNGFLDGQ